MWAMSTEENKQNGIGAKNVNPGMNQNGSYTKLSSHIVFRRSSDKKRF